TASGGERTPATSFNVYVASGGGGEPFDFDTPAHQVNRAGRQMSVQLGPYAHGTVVRVVVRSVGAPGSGAEESNTDEVTATADALAPDAPSTVSGEVIDE